MNITPSQILLAKICNAVNAVSKFGGWLSIISGAELVLDWMAESRKGAAHY
ncbi:hypothetical protein [Hyphomicrobium sulfonivorans]|uniref:hypothetical protein n=1 Tax=Hyphomicrobium sulfonivorans TaxID=121290 RepID=UPI00156FD25F|nr:hypothetical protein [Hyphomicrobium sulfonivorans]MBI1649783.1 hypothetical protein [Hyphomicrobium sulfonivorans]